MNRNLRWVRYAKYFLLVLSLLSSSLIPFLLDHLELKLDWLDKYGAWIIGISILLSVILDFLWDTLINNNIVYTKGDTEKVVKFIDHELEQIHGRYSKIIYNDMHEVVPIIRINLMILTKKKSRKFMQIHACYTPNSADAYSTAEKEIEWGYGLGCCGKSWKSKEQRCFDRSSTDCNLFLEGLSLEQKSFTSHVTSILSTPILSGDNVIAILNIDSPEGMNMVKFNNNQISWAIRDEARMLTSIIHAPILLTDGAKSHWKGQQHAKQTHNYGETKKN